MDHLSPELILAFFEVFPLKTLIAAQGVNKQWRSLVPKTTMLPARRKLYDLYHVAIVSPAFLANRAVLVQKLVPFDRRSSQPWKSMDVRFLTNSGAGSSSGLRRL